MGQFKLDHTAAELWVFTKKATERNERVTQLGEAWKRLYTNVLEPAAITGALVKIFKPDDLQNWVGVEIQFDDLVALGKKYGFKVTHVKAFVTQDETEQHIQISWAEGGK